MFNLGGPEILLLVVLALVLVGPRRMPEVGRALGALVAEFRKATGDLRAGIEKEVDLTEIRKAGAAVQQARRELGDLATTPARVLTREVREAEASAAGASAAGASAAAAVPRDPAPLDARSLGLAHPERPTREELARSGPAAPPDPDGPEPS